MLEASHERPGSDLAKQTLDNAMASTQTFTILAPMTSSMNTRLDAGFADFRGLYARNGAPAAARSLISKREVWGRGRGAMTPELTEL